MISIDFEKIGIDRLYKVRWWFPKVSSSKEILDCINSSKLSKYLQKTEEIFQDAGITVEQRAINKEEYLEWWSFYEKIQKRHGYRVVAERTWYDEKMEEGARVEGMFFYKNEQLIAGKIYKIKDGVVTGAYKSSLRIDDFYSKVSFGACIDYVWLKNLVKRGLYNINFGCTLNAFGVHNSIGLLNYKLKFGQIAKPKQDYQREKYRSEVPFVQDMVSFFVLEQDQVKLVSIIDQSSQKALRLYKRVKAHLFCPDRVYDLKDVKNGNDS